ncbi:MAG TPA: hypothetical protein VFN59_02115 [Acidimicrobiales bacterium]|nr:hypothetical protein [Acidimicrobiales bacterium]
MRAGVALAAAVLAGLVGTGRAGATLLVPYDETYAPPAPAVAVAAAHLPGVTLAFLSSEPARPCAVAWNGDPATPLATFAGSLRAYRGAVVVSFGGYGADHAGTDVAMACHSVRGVYRAYRAALATYRTPYLDLDLEDRALEDPASLARRLRALELLRRTFSAHHRRLVVVLTVPADPAGLTPAGAALVRRYAPLDPVVNAMAFDFFDGRHHAMAAAAEGAARGVARLLGALDPRASAAERWARVALTVMIGLDDRGRPETFTLGDARALVTFARARGLFALSYWALQRDNGNCPGARGRDSCSGVAQARDAFARAFRRVEAPSRG